MNGIEKAIEEIDYIIDLWTYRDMREFGGANIYYNTKSRKDLATALYDAGYRKFDEIEILTELYKVANESVDKSLTLTTEDIKLIAKRCGVKIGEEK